MFRPMKGTVAPTDLSSLRYPLLASEKIDGWRCLIVDIDWARTNIPCEPKHREYFAAARSSIALSASLKPIANWHVQRQLDRVDLVGCDGELIASDKFNETSSTFASFGGEPSFAFHIFDLFDRPSDSFESRLLALKNKWLPPAIDSVELRKHPHFQIMSAALLTEYLEEQLPVGAEGAVTRDPRGLYKFGRATEKQQWLLKVKFEEDFEAVVIGYEQGTQNLNELEYNQLGLAKRSSHQENKVPVDILGALTCELNGIQFRVGIFKGFSKEDLKLMWSVRDTLIGRIAKLQKMTHGEKDKPRHPRFLGFRAEDYSAGHPFLEYVDPSV